jgi:hypothetical protein
MYMIIGLVCLLCANYHYHAPATSFSVQESQEFKPEISTGNLNLGNEIFIDKNNGSRLIGLDLVVDRNSVLESINYNELVNYVNETYKNTDIKFYINSVVDSSLQFKNYNLKSQIFKIQPLNDNNITICIVGKHEGLTVGQAVYNGMFNNFASAIVDLNGSSIQEQANIVAHEIGHLFGLKHSHDNSLMRENSSEEEMEFSEVQNEFLRELTW